MTHFLTTPKFDLLSYIYIINFLNLPVHALIHDLQKKTYGHQLGPMTHFLTTPKFDLLLYIGEKCLRTHLQSFLCALINDPKKLFQKKVYVTIPQWFETFPNMSDLWSGLNRAKCGLALNDPIDWFKLRLNQPKRYLWFGQKRMLGIVPQWKEKCELVRKENQRSRTKCKIRNTQSLWRLYKAAGKNDYSDINDEYLCVSHRDNICYN